MGVFASDEVRERAACEFLKWFTQPEQNIRFAVSTGYLPVEQEALSSVPELLRNVDDTGNAAAITSGINAYLEAGRQYAFYAKKKMLCKRICWRRIASTAGMILLSKKWLV